MIENTASPASRDITGLLMFATGDADAIIGAQEKAGQQQLVHSDRLPTDLSGDRADWEALGFTFGAPDPQDPLFMPATLPEGWTRQGSDHAMGSYVVDTLGRRRVSVFYKAAFYDRSASATLISLSGYLRDRVYHDQPIVTDDTWATPAAVLAAARQGIADAEQRIADWTKHGNAQYVAEYTAERDKYAAIAAAHDNA